MTSRSPSSRSTNSRPQRLGSHRAAAPAQHTRGPNAQPGSNPLLALTFGAHGFGPALQALLLLGLCLAATHFLGVAAIKTSHVVFSRVVANQLSAASPRRAGLVSSGSTDFPVHVASTAHKKRNAVGSGTTALIASVCNGGRHPGHLSQRGASLAATLEPTRNCCAVGSHLLRVRSGSRHWA